MATLEQLKRYLRLDRKHLSLGLSDDDLTELKSLKSILARHLGVTVPELAADESLVVPVRIKVFFTTMEMEQESLMTSFSRSGAFINTAFVPEIGIEVPLRICDEESNIDVSLRSKVLSNNLGEEFSVHGFGMAVRFIDLEMEQRQKLNELYEAVVQRHWGTSAV